MNVNIARGAGCVTQIYDGDGIAEISTQLPKGSAVAVVYEQDDCGGEYMRKLRRAGMAPRPARAGDSDAQVTARQVPTLPNDWRTSADCRCTWRWRLRRQ